MPVTPHLESPPVPPRSRAAGSRRRAAAAGAAAGTALLLLGTWSPAAAATTTQSASCLDGGGVRWSARAVWGDTYPAADGSRRVTLDYVGWTTTKAGTVATDSSVRTYDGAGTLIQQLPWTGGFSYRSGQAFKVRNPINPPSAPGRTKVTVTLGVDGDGFGDCTVTFVQPGSTPTPSTPAPSTPAPSTPAPSTPAPSTPGGGAAGDVYEADVLSATNGERSTRGLVGLTASTCVDGYAEAQSARMAAESRMYHQDLRPILSACGLTAVAENVAYGYPDGRAVTAGWMGSTGHRENILNPRYRLLGVGATQDGQGRWYVAQVFGVTG